MPLGRLEDDHRTSTHRGVEFWMSDENGGLVFCRISHEALQDHADRNHLAANDNEIFEAYRSNKSRAMLSTRKLAWMKQDASSSRRKRSTAWAVVLSALKR